MPKHIAIYVRVSTDKQSTASQMPDLQSWAARQSDPIVWYEDHFTGKTMNRPGWGKLQQAIDANKVLAVVVWKIDRLGRLCAALAPLFYEFQSKGINLVALKDNIDLSTPAGRLHANQLAAYSQYDNECRTERIVCGMAVAKAAGKKWGGSKPGRRTKATADCEQAAKQMYDNGVPITRIANTLKLSRPTIYSLLFPTQACQPS